MWFIARPFRLGTERHTDGVNYVAVCLNPPLVVTASEDMTCHVYAPVKGHWSVRQVLRGHTAAVSGVAIAQETQAIATSSFDATCRVWERGEDGLWECQAHNILRGHTDTVFFLVIRSDGRMVASVSADKTCRLWLRHPGAGGWQCSQVLEGHSDDVYGVALASDLSFVMTASGDQTCRVWTPHGKDWRCQQILTGHTEGLNTVAISHDTTVAMTGSEDHTCRIWVRRGGAFECQQVLEGHAEGVLDVAISDDLTLLATSGHDSTCRLHVWHRASHTWKFHQVLKGHSKAIYGVRIAKGEASELVVGTGSEDQTAIMWRWDGRSAYKRTQIRYASDLEMAFKVINLAVACFQKARFAFSANIPWNKHSVKNISFAFSLSTLDFSFDLKPEDAFLAKTFAAEALVILFVLFAVCQRGKVLVLVASTMAVVPIVSQLVGVFACTDGHLDEGPEMACYEGLHLILAYTAPAFGLLYLLLLVPFTAAEGDLQVMPRYVWLHPREWVRRKLDKVLGLDLGSLNPAPAGAMPNAYANLVVSLALPCADLFTHVPPRIHGCVTLGFSMIPLIVTMRWPPLEDRLVNAILIVAHLCCINAFVAALVALFLDQPESLVPTKVLLAGWALIVFGFFFWFTCALCCRRFREEPGDSQGSSFISQMARGRRRAARQPATGQGLFASACH